MKKCQTATTTPVVKVVNPNGGKYYKRPNDGAILIKWRNTTKDKTVDIDLKTASSTTLIAKDVKGTRLSTRFKNMYSTHMYQWKNAPIGKDYKIVITAKDGSTTYTDESDATFSVEKNPRGKRWIEPKENAGDVRGASTSEEDEIHAMLDTLEDTLAEMTVALDSR
jgi:hypothetical protein